MNPYSSYGFPYGWSAYIPSPKRKQMPMKTHDISKVECDFKSFMRLLWEQHVTWTRLTILSLVFQLPDLNAVVAQLLRNATDMGNSLRVFYGDQVADTYSRLINEHLTIAADLVKAAISGNQKLVDTTEKKWYANANDISIFLSNINPFLSKEEVREMFYKHLALTKSEAVFMIMQDYESGVHTFDKIEEQALEMADMISHAIVKQFPERF
ncbi:putative transcriptional regulator [Bacillus sp. TS-2]|nr:putative transcriptional regulator [Bacillus sp. TS-2]